MKKGKYHIFQSWILLFCFAAGQYMVYAHQHPSSTVTAKPHYISQAAAHQQTFKEKCYMCDVMHNNVMLASYQVHLKPVTVICHLFKVFECHFSNTRQIASGGRAPPIV